MTMTELSKADFEKLSEFRYQLRLFLRFSEGVCREHGLTPLQYQMLLHVQGYPGRDWATIGELAERLQAHHHGVVALAGRCEELGLIERRTGTRDRRQVEIHLTEQGRRQVTKLAALHRDEIRMLKGKLVLPDLTPPM
ncbi:MarR family winged helix-turn-helix transcriptional regulator [Chitinivorax sp. B]|uniref:MarR family winged helix-turn-helix transcriptional regulator n=1 Tax=Chitinivorax sp. B TaxID=2502235 RepID=UPI0010F9B086|nr:MarR family winged helix-turn-helix transcriptional regulator [Chitinivorax sp. B]